MLYAGMRIRSSILFIFFCCLFVHSNGQSNLLDSLKKRLSTEKEDTSKIHLEISICKAYNSKGDFLDALDYGIRALRRAKNLQALSNSAIVLSARKSESQAYTNIGNAYDNQGNYSQAELYYTKALKTKEALGDKRGIAGANNNLGLVFWSQSNYPVALDYFLKSQNMYEELGYKPGVALTLNNIGLLYMEEENNDSALTYFKKSLAIEQSQNNREGIDRGYNNIAIIYRSKKKYPEAINYYSRSLSIRKELGNTANIAVTYTNIANAYGLLTKEPDSIKSIYITAFYGQNVHAPTIKQIDKILIDSAEILYQKALAISKEAGDMTNIAESIEGLGLIEKNRGDYKQALDYFKNAASIYKKMSSLKEYDEALLEISDGYEKLKQPDSALLFFQKEASIHDTIFNEDKQKAIGREEVRYAYEKKQAVEEAESKKQHELEEEHRKRQQLIIYAGTGGILLLGIFLIFVVQRLRITNRQKNIIGEQKEKLDSAFGELGNAKKLLEERHKDLTDSIQYASRIQNALLTSEKYLTEYLKDYFIFFQPKDIVSGDFYWALNRKGKFYIACCDCTGHGVPGAFMSLLNINFLHQTVIEKNITHPNEIFNTVRTNVVDALNPDGTSDKKDGMDATLCSIDFEKHMLMAACANNPLWIIRNKELIEFKPDKMPIGISGGDDIKPFTLHEINLLKGDCIYMLSDGFADQFGGPAGKKFKSSQLRELVLSVADKPMKEQRSIFEKTINDWKGSQEQVDDICLIGIRI